MHRADAHRAGMRYRQRQGSEEPGMEIDLPPGLKAFVEEKVATGLYASPAEVICDALRGFRERDVAWRAHVAAEIEKGWESAERGDTVDGEEFFDQLLAELEAKEAAQPVKT